jgi:transcriptional regulator with XRE-family HTH domain
MEKKIGMKQAQYQRIESGENTKIKTLERVLKALKLKMILIPQDKLDIILPFLTEEENHVFEQPLSLLERYQVSDDE